MAHHAHGNSKNETANASSANVNGGVGGENEVKPTTFHDFLGNKGQGHESVPAAVGGGRQPTVVVSPSATSDLGSERHVSNHLEGIPFYGSRGDITGPESSKRFIGYKRSNSDSLMVASRDKFQPGQSDPQDNMLLTKLLRYSGAERSRRPINDEPSFNMQQVKPISATLLSQSHAANRADANTSKRDRAMPINMGPTLQYPPRSGQFMQFGNQTSSNRFKETNVVSQTAADEGSRTGIKGSGILNSMNATGPMSGRQPSGVLIRTGKQKSGTFVPEPESSTVPSQRGTELTGRQMTIFYGGQAHVFDNVHPNKADVIMALAGSNGGSWFTNCASNSAAARPSTGYNHRLPVDENDAGISILTELHGRPSDKGDALCGFGSGSYEGIIRSKEKMASAQAAKVGAEDEC